MSGRSASRSVSPRSGRSGRSPMAGNSSGATALVMSGWQGKFAAINGTYEQAGRHNDFPCWVNRINTNCIFHTAKTRWVVSKELGDGSACFAFIQDPGSTEHPGQCTGTWTRCNESGEWVPDKGITCSPGSASNDPFVHIRYEVEADMVKVKIASEADREKMWNLIDRNGDGVVDLSEVEQLVADLVKTGVWPRWLGNEVALQRAYAKTLEDSTDGDDQVQRGEFYSLLLNIFWFGRIHEIYDSIETGGDSDVNLIEFQQGMDKMGIKLSRGESEAEFRQMDKDSSGLVDFSEFCLWVRSRVQPNASSGRSSSDDQKIVAHEQVRVCCGNKATAGVVVKKKNWADFDKVEKQLQKMVADPDKKVLKKLWSSLDYNGNNRVSLAEVDKWAVEQYPILNHKPALMRAQQATLQAGGGKDFVEKKDFKTLLVNLFYYNKLFWVFDQSDEDHDRRMDLKEFQYCLTMCGVKLSPSKAQQEFNTVDADKGGMILFEEFCKYFVSKKCPEGLTAFVE